MLLVTSGNRFLDQALRSLQGVQIEHSRTLLDDDTAATAGEAPPATPAVAGVGGYGLVVTDGVLTGTLPASGGLWLIAPGAGTACGEPGELFTPTAAVQGQWTHSLLQYVDWSEVHGPARAPMPHRRMPRSCQGCRGPLLLLLIRPASASPAWRSTCMTPICRCGPLSRCLPRTWWAGCCRRPRRHRSNPSLRDSSGALRCLLKPRPRRWLRRMENACRCWTRRPCDACHLLSGSHYQHRDQGRRRNSSPAMRRSTRLLDEAESDLRPRSLLIDGVPLSTSAVSQGRLRN